MPLATESGSPALQRAPTEAAAPKSPEPFADTTLLQASGPRGEKEEPGGRVGIPTIAVGRGQAHGPEAQSQGPAPAGVEDLVVDTGLVQRLTARAEGAVQRTPEVVRMVETVELEPPPATTDVTPTEQPEPSAGIPVSDEQASLPPRTPPAHPLPVAPPPSLPREVGVPARAPVERVRSPAPFELPLAPRPAVVQRAAVRGEAEVGEPPEQTFTVETTTESQTLAEIPASSIAPLELLDDGDMMQLAREVLPIVKRLLRAELERRSQPDLDW